MAGTIPAVGETARPWVVDELPRVTTRMKRELQHPVAVGVAHDLTCQRWLSSESVVVLSARADNELADAGRIESRLLKIRLSRRCAVSRGRRVLRRDSDRIEALIVVVVAREDDIRVRLEQQIPDVGHPLRVAVLAGREAGLVPVGQRAEASVLGEVALKTLVLDAARRTAADAGRALSVGALAVKRDQVPGSEVVAVPTERVGRVEVPNRCRVVVPSTRTAVLVISGCPLSDREQAAPAGGVACGIRVGASAFVLRVAEVQHGVWFQPHDQIRGVLLPA